VAGVSIFYRGGRKGRENLVTLEKSSDGGASHEARDKGSPAETFLGEGSVPFPGTMTKHRRGKNRDTDGPRKRNRERKGLTTEVLSSL